MNFRRISKVLMVLLTIVLVLIGTVGVGFAQGLVEYALVLVLVPEQTVDIRGEDGNSVGTGTIEANVTTDENGVTDGALELVIVDPAGTNEPVTVTIVMNAEVPFLDAQGQVVRVDLPGQGRIVKNGLGQSFPATVTMEPETAVPAGCTWSGGVSIGIIDNSMRPVLPGGFYADTSDATIVSGNFVNGWPSKVTGPVLQCD